MKTIDRSYASQGSMPGEKIEMSVDTSSLRFLMQTLSGLYKDPELAIVREYATNAWDSHVEAGVSLAIEVTTPTALHPFYTVRDFGVGMNVEDIRNTYSKYGASTKRGSNDYNGQLGLGSKCAFAYTQQFTVIGVKDGIRTQVLVARDGGDTATMTILAETPTDEHNGVTIQVPVQRHNEFERKAWEFFAWWKPGTVLLDDEDPTKPPVQRDGAVAVSDTITIVPRVGYRTEDVVVMGNVAYPLEIGLGDYAAFDVIAEVPIGALQMTPSREAIEDSPHTREVTEKLRETVKREIAKAFQRRFDAQTSRQDVLKLYATWWTRKTFQRVGVAPTWRGESIPEEIDLLDEVRLTNLHRRPRSRADLTSKLSMAWAPSTCWFYGYDAAKFTAPMKDKMVKFLEGKAGYQYAILAASKPTSPWIDPGSVFNWADVKAIKLPRTVSRSTFSRPSGSYPFVYDLDARDFIARRDQTEADIDTSRSIFYSVGSVNHGVQRTLHELDVKGTLVILPNNRLAKFCRTFPSAMEASAAAKAAAERYKTQHYTAAVKTEAALSAMSYRRNNDFDALRRYVHRLWDPALIAAATRTKDDAAKRVLAKLYNLAGWGMIELEVPELVVDPLALYPLFDVINLRHHTDEVIVYLNASFMARQQGLTKPR